jgi:nucleotide-binding universal stress UspA family protein
MAPTDSAILIAYDGSPPARHAIEHAGRLFSGSPVVVATAWTSMREAARAARAALPQAMIDDAVRNVDTVAEQTAAETAAEGAELATAAGLTASPLTVRADPSVWATLVRYAEEHEAPAVVVGSRGQSRIRSALLGSVSNAIVQHCRRPVLVVHPPDTPAVDA